MYKTLTSVADLMNLISSSKKKVDDHILNSVDDLMNLIVSSKKLEQPNLASLEVNNIKLLNA